MSAREEDGKMVSKGRVSVASRALTVHGSVVADPLSHELEGEQEEQLHIEGRMLGDLVDQLRPQGLKSALWSGLCL